MIKPLRPGYSFFTLGRNDSTQLTRINHACPIVADFTFYFDRGNDFFAWPDLCFEAGHRYVGIRYDDKLVGYGMIGLNRGHLGNDDGTFLYLGDWRILPDHRGHDLGLQGTEVLHEDVPDEVRYGYCLVKRGNTTVEGLLRTRESTNWTARPLCGFTAINLLFIFKPAPPRRHHIRRATTADASLMADAMGRAWAGKLFAPPAPDPQAVSQDLARLERIRQGGYYIALESGQVIGALRVWDSHSVKRTTVLCYPRRGKLLRLGYMGAQKLLSGMAPLPPDGGSFRALTLHRVAVPEQDPEVLRDLILAVLRDHHGCGYHMAHLGFTEHDPLRTAVRRLPAQRFDSEIYLIARRGEVLREAMEPWIDIASI